MEISSHKTVSMPTLVAFVLSTIINIMVLGVLASNGFSSLILIGIAVIFFFIPSIFICNELAAIWPSKQGVFHWVTKAYGKEVALLTTWLQWVTLILIIPTVTSLCASVIAYCFNLNELAQSKTFAFIITLCIVYLMSLVNAFGERASVRLGMLNFIGVTVIPVLVLIVSCVTWLSSGNHPANPINFSHFFPQKHAVTLLTFFGTVILAFAGIDQPAYYITVAKSPLTYIKAVVFAGIIIVLVPVIGVITILVFVPVAQVHPEDGLLQTFSHLANVFHNPWINYITLFSLGIGLIANAGCLQAVCARALQAISEGKLLPNRLGQTNRFGAPTFNLLIQAIIVTLVSLIFILMPTLNNAFVFLFVIMGITGASRYYIIFLALLKLRKKFPKKHANYKSKINPSVTVGSGIAFISLAILCSFIPPDKMNFSVISYEFILIIGCVITMVIPLVYYTVLKYLANKRRHHKK